MTFDDALDLVLLLPGKRAKQIRSQISTIIRRYLGGDKSLITEIEANAASSSPIAQLARASTDVLANVVPAIVDHLSILRKRKMEELEMEAKKLYNHSMEAEIEAKKLSNHSMEAEIEAKKLSNLTMSRTSAREYHSSALDHLVKITNNYRELCQDTVMDERARLILKGKFLDMLTLQDPPAPTIPDDKVAVIEPAKATLPPVNPRPSSVANAKDNQYESDGSDYPMPDDSDGE